MTRKRLPIGIQTFAKIREDDYYYVDKTAFARQLIDSGTHYFLSRPRRFGKSLFLDTLAELFAGREHLFRGLHIHPHWDWSQRFPVIRLSFGGGIVRTRAELDQRLDELLSENAETLGVTMSHHSLSGRFAQLIRGAAE
ncbi:AAA family ATPase, partial [Thioalkalicoccus limnaeus]